MNYKSLILLIGFAFSTCLTVAQDFGSAVILAQKDIKEAYGANFVSSLHQSILKSGGSDFQFFSWSGADEQPILYAPLKRDGMQEQPVTAVAYIEANLKGFDKLSLTSQVDTSGKVTGYFLNLFQSTSPKFKVVHLPTAEVLISKAPSPTKPINGGKILIKDYTKYSKVRPEKLYQKNKKLYDEVLAKIKKAQQKNITRIYDETIKNTVALFKEASTVLLSRSDTRLWSVADAAQVDEKKLKSFWIDAPKTAKLKKGQNINVYGKQTYGGKEVYDQLTLAGVTVKEVTDSKTLVETNIFNRKKIKKAISEGAELVLARNPKLVRFINTNSGTAKRVQVKSNCFTCAIGLESELAKIPMVILIERQFDPVRNYFVNQYTDEKYMDFDMGKVQGKAEGVDYLFEVDDNGLQATNVATSRIKRVDQKQKKGWLVNMIFGGLDPADVINLSLDILDLKIELLEITSAKKGKAKKVLLYSPMGFGNSWKVSVIREIEETVGSRTLIRNEEIGTLSGRAENTPSVKKYKVKSGGKEIFEAKATNENIKFIVQ